MKKTTLLIGAAFLAVIFLVSATTFRPAGDIDLQGYYNIINGGNASFQRISVTSNINASTKNITVQCVLFDSGGKICSS